MQVVDTAEGVALKRGCTEVHIRGERAGELVRRVLAATASHAITREDLAELFAAPDRKAVDALVDELLQRRLLIDGGPREVGDGPPPAEDRVDVFYWDVGRPRSEAEEGFNGWSFHLLGVNGVSYRLAAALRDAGHRATQVIDFQLLRGTERFGGGLRPQGWLADLDPPLAYAEWQDGFAAEERDVLIATSDFGGFELLRDWNRFAVEEGLHFLPVVVQNLTGFVGPLVVPGETPCFECLVLRMASNHVDREAGRALDRAAAQGQATTSMLPSVAAMVAELAAVELLKFYGGGLTGWRTGTLLELRPLAPDLAVRRVLKVPRCPVCSSLNRVSSTAVERFVLTAPSIGR